MYLLHVLTKRIPCLQPSRHSKLEKADILELTVKHLQEVQRRRLGDAVARDPTVLHKFRGGFAECAQEVNRLAFTRATLNGTSTCHAAKLILVPNIYLAKCCCI